MTSPAAVRWVVALLISASSLFVFESRAHAECGRRAAWTILFFSNGDNDLQNDLARDLAELAEAGSTPIDEMPEEPASQGSGLHVVMLLDTDSLYSERNSFLIRVKKNSSRDWQVETGPEWAGSVAWRDELNMADGATLQAFLKEALACYPSDRVALIINGHGSGARNEAQEDLQHNVPRAFGRDDHTPHDIMYVAEVVEAIRGALEPSGRTAIDMIGLDSCLMSTVEVAYAFREVTPVIVASENLEGPAGWRHNLWLGPLSMNPLSNGEDLARYVTTHYRNGIETSYTKLDARKWLNTRTLVASVLTERRPPVQCVGPGIDGVVRLLDALAAGINRSEGDELAQRLMSARRTCRSFGPTSRLPLSSDLGCIMHQFRREIENRPEFETFGSYATGILASLECMVVAKEIPDEWSSDPFSGIGVFMPKERTIAESSAIFSDRMGSAKWPMKFFARATNWASLLGDRRLLR